MKIESYRVPSTSPALRIGHLSDLHYGKTPGTSSTFRCALQRVIDYGLDVLVISGDLVQVPDDHDQLSAVKQVLDGCGVPYVTVSGNHDVRTPGEAGAFASYFGYLPRIERIAGATFLLFDSFNDLPVAERGPEDFDETWECWGDGEVKQQQLDQMASLLRPADELRLAVVHHHLDDEPHPHVNPLRNSGLFVDWCRDHGVYAVFVGHLHRTAEPCDLDGLLRLRVGRTTKAPCPAAVLDLAAGDYLVFTDSE